MPSTSQTVDLQGRGSPSCAGVGSAPDRPGHLLVLKKLRKFTGERCRVDVITPSVHHFYSGMGPGLLGGFYGIGQTRFDVKTLSEKGVARFIEDRVVRVLPEQRILLLKSGRRVPYDVVSFNTGSRVEPPPNEQARIFPVKPIRNLARARASIQTLLPGGDRLRIIVVGGGAAGVEVAANSCCLVESEGGRASISLLSHGHILSRWPAKAQCAALETFRKLGARVLEDARVEMLEGHVCRTSGGEALPFDLALVATGVRPGTLFRQSGLPTGPQGGLRVNPYLQSAQHPEIYGTGDCIYFDARPLERIGVHAVRQSPVLLANLQAALRGDKLAPYEPAPTHLLILNMGDGSGIACRGNFTWHGRSAFILKDLIDRHFVRKYRTTP